MPQKRNGKSVDPNAGLDSAHAARGAPGFVGGLRKMTLADAERATDPKDWGSIWKPFPGGASPTDKLFCIAIDGSLPPGAQPIAIPRPRHAASRHFSFFPVCARAVPWPASFEEALASMSLWTPMAAPAIAGCAAGFVAALPGVNMGHGAAMAPMPAYLSATQAALERPWSEWGFERLDLTKAGDRHCPAETLAHLTGNYSPSDATALHPKSLSCPRCGKDSLLRAGSPQSILDSLQASGGENEWLFICHTCDGGFRSMAAISDHIASTHQQRSMAFMELLEALLYVEIAQRIVANLSDPASPFAQVVGQLGATPLLLVKDGPLVVSPTSKLAPYLASWAKNLATQNAGQIILVGIEKNSAILSEIARDFALGQAHVNHYCQLDGKGQGAWSEGSAPRPGKEDPLGRSKWARKFAVVLPQGACVISTPVIGDAVKFDAVLSHIFQNLGAGAQPTTEGIVRFPLLAHLQKHTALPAREKAMAHFAYQRIMEGASAVPATSPTLKALPPASPTPTSPSAQQTGMPANQGRPPLSTATMDASIVTSKDENGKSVFKR